MQEIWDYDSNGPDACHEDLRDFNAADDDIHDEWAGMGGILGESEGAHQKRELAEEPARDAGFDAFAPHRLGVLRVMPIEILYEIFMHVSPQDLLNLSRTAKGLRALLMTRRAVSIWRAALKSEPDAPECPRGFSEPRWADLIWGGKTCTECDREGIAIMVAIIYLRRRACMRCLSDHLIAENELTAVFPSFDPSLLRMIPYLQVKSSRAKLYWDQDVEWTLSQLERHKRFIAFGFPDAEKTLERFKQQCEAEVDERMEHARRCEAWALDHGYLL